MQCRHAGLDGDLDDMADVQHFSPKLRLALSDARHVEQVIDESNHV
jgi:hypothetical protein